MAIYHVLCCGEIKHNIPGDFVISDRPDGPSSAQHAYECGLLAKCSGSQPQPERGHLYYGVIRVVSEDDSSQRYYSSGSHHPNYKQYFNRFMQLSQSNIDHLQQNGFLEPWSNDPIKMACKQHGKFSLYWGGLVRPFGEVNGPGPALATQNLTGLQGGIPYINSRFPPNWTFQVTSTFSPGCTPGQPGDPNREGADPTLSMRAPATAPPAPRRSAGRSSPVLPNAPPARSTTATNRPPKPTTGDPRWCRRCKAWTVRFNFCGNGNRHCSKCGNCKDSGFSDNNTKCDNCVAGLEAKKNARK